MRGTDRTKTLTVEPFPPTPADVAASPGPPTGGASRANRHRRRAPLWLGFAVAIGALTLAGCAGGDDSPVDVSLATLARQEDAYKGRLVRTQGVVRTFEQPRHYWIEDDYPNRVALEPEELVAPWLGQEVRVVGRFDFDERKGRVIEIEEIAPSPSAPGADRGGS